MKASKCHPLQQRFIIRAIEGAFKNAMFSHPDWVIDSRFVRSVTKRALGTLASGLGVLATQKLLSKGSNKVVTSLFERDVEEGGSLFYSIGSRSVPKSREVRILKTQGVGEDRGSPTPTAFPMHLREAIKIINTNIGYCKNNEMYVEKERLIRLNQELINIKDIVTENIKSKR